MRIPHRFLSLAMFCLVCTGMLHAQAGVRYKQKQQGANLLTEQQKADANRAYFAALHKYCPKQRIDLQSPVQMNMQVQDFEHHISPPQTQRYREFVNDSCPLHQPAAACANTAMLAAANEGKFLDRFAVFECEKGIRCVAAGKCINPR